MYVLISFQEGPEFAFSNKFSGENDMVGLVHTWRTTTLKLQYDAENALHVGSYNVNSKSSEPLSLNKDHAMKNAGPS